MLHLSKVMVKESFDALNIIYNDLDGFLPCLCFGWTIEVVTLVIEMMVTE